MERENEFQTGKLMPMILKFSIPAALSLLITAIYNIVDRIFVGNFVGTSALAGLSVCFPVSYIMMAFALMCSSGGSTLFSIFSGRKDREMSDRAFGNSVGLVVVSELVLTAVMLLLTDPILKVFGVTETCYEYAAVYYRIVVLGCVFQGLTQVFNDFVRVSGHPILGMCLTGSGAVTNIILDAVFVVGLDLGVAGAAWATVIGQVVSTVFGLVLIRKNFVHVDIRREIFRPDRKLLWKITTCGFAFWVAQMAMGLISLVYNGQLGKYGGDVAISVYAVVSSVMTFVIMPASGISQGTQPIIGNNYGSGNHKRVMETFYLSTLVSVGFTCIIWAVVMLFPKQILAAFGGTEEMFEIGITGLRLNFCITPVLGFVMLATTFFQSLERPVPSIIITLLRQVIVLIPLIVLLPGLMGVQGIFLAQPVSDGLATLLSLILVLRERRILLGSDRKDGHPVSLKKLHHVV